MFEMFAAPGWSMLCFIGGDKQDAVSEGGGAAAAYAVAGGAENVAQPFVGGGAEAPREGDVDTGSPNAANDGADGARTGGGAIARPMDEIACAVSGRATPSAMGCGVKAAPLPIGAEPFILGACMPPFIIGGAAPFIGAPFDGGAA